MIRKGQSPAEFWPEPERYRTERRGEASLPESTGASHGASHVLAGALAEQRGGATG
jgi:hypothetical protein